MDNNRSQLLLDIEHDMSLIKDRLSRIEDHFEDGGIIERLAETLHKLAVEVEQLKDRRDGHAE